MAIWQCNLCSYVFDEAKESTTWDKLPDDWVCPLCGVPKSEFSLKEESPSASKVYECDLCSHLYDESKESCKFDELAEDWVCPICGAKKISFSVHT